MEITAKEIERQAGRLEEQTEKAITIYNSRAGKLHHIASIIESEDSKLASTIERFKETHENVANQMEQKFRNLAKIMHEYAAQTIANETDTSSEVESLNANLSAIEDSLSADSDIGLGSER